MKKLTTYITEAFITKANLKKMSRKKYLFIPIRVKEDKKDDKEGSNEKWSIFRNEKWTSWNHRFEHILPYSVNVADMDDLQNVIANEFIPDGLVADSEIVKHYKLRIISYEKPNPKEPMLKELIQQYLKEIDNCGYMSQWNCKTVYFVEMVDTTDESIKTTIGYINGTQDELEHNK